MQTRSKGKGASMKKKGNTEAGQVGRKRQLQSTTTDNGVRAVKRRTTGKQTRKPKAVHTADQAGTSSKRSNRGHSNVIVVSDNDDTGNEVVVVSDAEAAGVAPARPSAQRSSRRHRVGDGSSAQARSHALYREAAFSTLLRQCIVCYDDKPTAQFRHLTASCTHTPNVCNKCVRRYLQEEVKQMKEGGIKCPSIDCAQSIAISAVSNYAGQRTGNEANQRLSLKCLESLENFRWCAHERCGNGQLIEGESSYMICNACGGRTCITHRCVWHDGRSCVEYDAWVESETNGGAKSTKWVQQYTQQCPKCKHGVQKSEGCDHMTCRCGCHFCYVCGADYKGTPYGNIHKPGCTLYVAPP